jgi:hypothetical protein
MKIYLLMSIIFANGVFAGGLSPENAVPTSGNMLELHDGDFQMRTPVGWQMFNDVYGIDTIIKAPSGEDTRFQRMLQVMSFDGGVYMDDTTMKQFAKIIENRFKNSSDSVAQYTVLGHQNSGLDTPSVIFYASFQANMFDMMHLHILFSSANKHYLVTFTDLAEHFEEGQDQNLVEAWKLVESIQVQSQAPNIFKELGIYFGLALLFVLGGFLFHAFRQKQVAREYASDSIRSDEEEPLTQQETSTLSRFDAYLDREDDTDADAENESLQFEESSYKKVG